MRFWLNVTAGMIVFAAFGFQSPEHTFAESNAPTAASGQEALATATFAGGCFWCMEPPFDGLTGVRSTTSGYTGGTVPNPTYKEVSAGNTGHVEAVQIVYDPAQVSYAQLLDVFWRNIDPLSADGQFCDRGPTYRSAILYHGEEQRRLAEGSKRKWDESGRFNQPIVTTILPVSAFYPAEDYHQDYYRTHRLLYKFYRLRCGRDARLEALWGDAPH
jgi:peptide-methionine (S)-S-oxide reductase